MVDVNTIPVNKCRFKGCKDIAEFELTDVILADKDKHYEDRRLKTVTVSYACEEHLEKIRLKYT
jgi:hypothetical protein|tara:strand:- start:331 stop:522 length:192 start_codon:yes stop_codon:yes gene_type:complete